MENLMKMNKGIHKEVSTHLMEVPNLIQDVKATLRQPLKLSISKEHAAEVRDATLKRFETLVNEQFEKRVKEMELPALFDKLNDAKVLAQNNAGISSTSGAPMDTPREALAAACIPVMKQHIQELEAIRDRFKAEFEAAKAVSRDVEIPPVEDDD